MELLTVVYSAEREPYTYRFRAHYFTGEPKFYPLGPGKVKVINYQVLECPPVEQFLHDFWQECAPGGQSLGITAHVGGEPEELRSLFCDSSPHSTVLFRSRPQEEMQFLSALYNETLRRKRKNEPLPSDFDFAAPSPGKFGLESFEPYPDLTEKLLAYEERLSLGSLRDIVHALGVMRKLHSSRDGTEQGALVDKLLQWLDRLPEIERHCVGGMLKSSAYDIYRDEPGFNRLVYESIQRCPESLYEFEDYRAYQLREFNRPGFHAYLRQREQERSNK